MTKEDDELKSLLNKIKKERAKQFKEELQAFEKERQKYIKELEEEAIEMPKKVSRAGQKPPPGSKNSDELLNQIEE